MRLPVLALQVPHKIAAPLAIDVVRRQWWKSCSIGRGEYVGLLLLKLCFRLVLWRTEECKGVEPLINLLRLGVIRA